METPRGQHEQSALASFLRARRAALAPDDVGLPVDPRRRVTGLRREEVARLAGISVEYYRRLEQGSGHQMSLQVCASLARALRLDRSGVAYLQRLALPGAEAVYDVHRGEAPPPDLVEMITLWDHTAAYIIDRNQDVLVLNDLMRAVAPGYMEIGNNLGLMQFEAPPEVRALPSWVEGARTTVSRLRYYGNPSDPRWQEIIALLLDDEDFADLWRRHEAHPMTSGRAPNFFPDHGWVDLRWQVLEAHPGLYTLVCYGAPGSLGERALAELRAGRGASRSADSGEGRDTDRDTDRSDGLVGPPRDNVTTPTDGSRLARYRAGYSQGHDSPAQHP
ncbi:helix-turn-helix transcriptional regulator [Curtobacterium sp. 458]|uniref:helix-turn-helix transcriptional regulator n=1 Tax=Curtobacterium sp. 458 TaxID=3050069 RepID=UPI0025B499D4|nr:helix-turn-helix transcriptional regulator [Curtobacterium sp. 458]WJY00209.1 helix-turn-helix transcriptional regulator [Curtobacterium sp. 458]